MIHAAGKPTVFLIAQAQREQRRLFKLGLEIPFRTIVQLRQSLGEADHLDGAFSEIVGFLRVEQQDPVRHFRLGDDERYDGAGA